MPRITFRIVNVFAETPFSGNQLAVVTDARGLSDLDMQRIARQLNLSECTFVLPSQNAAAYIRIFTPHGEMPFAGHPTLGSAHVVSEMLGTGDRFALEMPAGIIPVHLENGRWTLAANAPTVRPLLASHAELAAMLSLPVGAIGPSPMWVNCGIEHAMVELSSAAFVDACRPNAPRMHDLCMNATGQIKTYVFARTADGFVARFFSMSDQSNIIEDPGTGSACANLGGWWMTTEGAAVLDARVCQGTCVGRENVVWLSVRDGQISVGGRVVQIGSGELIW
jgi:trans-2,3-dihydro-3-hydroxyanthranilate isomerase